MSRILHGALIVGTLTVIAPPPADHAGPMPGLSTFKAVVRYETGEHITLTTTYFIGRHVIEIEEGGTAGAVYDLATQSWREGRNGRVFTLPEAERWARDTLDRTLAGLADHADSPQKRFAQKMVQPDFEVTTTETTLELRNEFFAFEIKTMPSPDQARVLQYYAFGRLIAYRKAMILKQAPPFLQLALHDELQRLSRLPAEILFTVTTPQGQVATRISFSFEDLNEQEQRLLPELVPN